ncbi:Eukaryotic peptide chain release factor subunit 1-1 [Thalictrum thalictroides]|uniref:Eukaryotic peptide chain release factor subunit 1-1 n=1 Tax=Thalictrum thalictroides TaxID=46969 RepID=A0A7J6V878_THATH|nr:Eukaryotic peptide chain release factor subunit 1-1 [Thalictrum thalictroides]
MLDPSTNQPHVAGLILAGFADFKKAKILNVVDVYYGRKNGFNQAIGMSYEILANVKYVQGKRLIGKYFQKVSHDTEKCIFDVDDTDLKALEMGVVRLLSCGKIWISTAELEVLEKLCSSLSPRNFTGFPIPPGV